MALIPCYTLPGEHGTIHRATGRDPKDTGLPLRGVHALGHLLKVFLVSFFHMSHCMWFIFGHEWCELISDAYACDVWTYGFILGRTRRCGVRAIGRLGTVRRSLSNGTRWSYWSWRNFIGCDLKSLIALARAHASRRVGGGPAGAWAGPPETVAQPGQAGLARKARTEGDLKPRDVASGRRTRHAAARLRRLA